jgi:transposase
METNNAGEVRRQITDECWAIMGPAIQEAKETKAGRPAERSLREFMEAVLWGIRTGVQWRDLPAEFGKWHTIYTRYRRWEARGVWKRLWQKVQAEDIAGATQCFIDSTTVRAHQHAAGAPGKTAAESALGRSRGGMTTKIHVASVNENHTLVIQITPGQASDCAQFDAIYEDLPKENVIFSAALDKGYDSNAIRAKLAEDGIEPVIPGRSNRIETIKYDKTKYEDRNQIERFFNKLKQFRRIATRYEKHGFTFLALIHIAAAFIAARN